LRLWGYGFNGLGGVGDVGLALRKTYMAADCR
jgi:hypothetical protein